MIKDRCWVRSILTSGLVLPALFLVAVERARAQEPTHVAGLYVTNSSNPFGSARIVSRGAGSILGQNQPLVIVDGIPIDNSAATNDGYGGGSLGGYDVGNAAADIDANNVESITVLKGPNAAALYGSRAANGAIVIVTKSGKGGPNQGFGVTAVFGTTTESPLRLPNYQNQYGQGFYGEFDFVDGNFGGINDGADESWGPKLDNRTTGCVYPRDAKGNPIVSAGYDTSKPCHQFFGVGPWSAHPNNVSDFWNTGVMTNMNVAVTKSSERNNVRLSVGRTGEAGMYPNNDNTRTDLTLSGGAQMSHHWRAEASIHYVNNISPYNGGGLLDVAETHSETNSDFLITGTRPLFKDLTVTVNAGGNARVNDFNGTAGIVSRLVIPGVYTLGNSDGSPSVGFGVSKKKVNSLYGLASFNFKDWLNVDVTGRNDWSSTLPRNQNSIFYPSVGAAFIVTDALRVQSHLLSYAKVRASWTRVGNDTDPYQLAAVYGSWTAWGGQPTFTAPDRLPNANLRPERTTGEEVGVDLGLFDNRVALNATVYQKSTTDQILPVSIPTETGYTEHIVNSGEVRNRGIELATTIRPIDRPTFRWEVVANWSKNTNKVLSLSNGVQRIVVGNYWGVSVTADSGQPYGTLVGTKWQRDPQGHIVVDSASGLPIRDSKQVALGNYNADWVGGITNTFTYKNLSLSFSFDGQMGGSVYSVTKWFGQYSGVLQATLQGREHQWNDRFVVPNAVYQSAQTGTPVFRPDTVHVLAQDYWHNTFYANEMGILDASYLKLRELRLAYEVPSSIAQHFGLSAATIAMVGHNLLLWAKQPTIDPETAFDTSNRQGVENGQLPTARSFGFTLSVRP